MRHFQKLPRAVSELQARGPPTAFKLCSSRRHEERSDSMRAKEHLNSVYLTGSLVVAGLVGTVSGSWVLGVLAAVVLVAMSLTSGRIRR